MDALDPRQEMTSELRRARGWLLGVGILQFVVDMIMIHGVYGDRLPADLKTNATLLDLGILVGFVALWWFARVKPKLCLTLGLVLFWGVHLYNAIQDPTTLYKGIIVKIFFTMALVRGLKSASRAQLLHEQLAKVFE
jgi:hypothetical protein